MLSFVNAPKIRVIRAPSEVEVTILEHLVAFSIQEPHIRLSAKQTRIDPLLDAFRNPYLEIERCFLLGDTQRPWIHVDPDALYALVAAHESTRMLLAYAAANNLELEEADIFNAYMFGGLNAPIIIEHPTDSRGNIKNPGYIYRLKKSIFGSKQAREV